ncbi:MULTISPECIES: TIGR04290 family methyltransferase [Xanthomonas]|uniref:TIGR04290 family methyltransferase n=2 Tax=Xanthomonas TaxID=338 RepID=A0A6N7Q5P2_9XANT|nr:MULTISPECIES: TIGR04290 family methyltransferase [Xanthomonas]AJC48095.1 SAM-dependent methyltransferase [Xanthomonas sacchari]KAA8921750.1 methyltransferase, TIGR04290 family [Xanthomonas sontii]KAB7765345.1 TIGR04290 family methyltransferase [Xanthomonas sp. LMG 12461]KAB7773149.1 methyltransferase, TIGR04290 family [Xanthomonas sp. LMG 12462]KAB7776304.1 methyltransferase, TIGR04290 family [Xanthomonas sp. LMG 12460]
MQSAVPSLDPVDPMQALGPWFHNLHLPDGRQTLPTHPYGDFPACKWRQIAPHVPADLRGWRVLDIGCNAGFYSFELARRGAEVVAIDMNPHYLRQAQWAAAQFGLERHVRFRQMQLYALAREAEQYDLVWMMGVLYHLRHPLLALDIVRRLCRRMLVLQTMTMPGEEVYPAPRDIGMLERGRMCEPGWPKMAFIEHRLADDPTNWWAPNHAGVEAMLRSAGFAVDARIAEETYLCRPQQRPPGQVAPIEEELRAACGLD